MLEPSHIPISVAIPGGQPMAEGSVLHRLLDMVAQRIARQRAAEGPGRDVASALTCLPRAEPAAGCPRAHRA